MEYSKIISVTGLPGLFELLGSKTDGAIVRSLDDQSTKFVSSRVHNFSHLESIEVYTSRDNVNLVDVFKAMQQSSETLPDDKNATAVKAYFEKVYPEMDFERVYASDLKKMVKWFAVLQKNEIEIKLRVQEEEDEDNIEEPETVEAVAADEPVEEQVAAKPKKAATKKTAQPAEETTTGEAPKKKTSKKKTE